MIFFIIIGLFICLLIWGLIMVIVDNLNKNGGYQNKNARRNKQRLESRSSKRK